MPTTLSTSSANSSITGVYIVERTSEYARGKAAKSAPPAVISQTWLASQNGVMERAAKSFCRPGFRNPSAIPAPKSNPPVAVNAPSKTPVSANQTASKIEISIVSNS